MHVHGHGQCLQCGTNVEPCCGGAAPGDAGDAPGDGSLDVEPQLFRRLVAQLGGEDATITAASLEQGFVQRQGSDLEEARAVIALAVRLGKLTAPGEGLLRLP